MTDISDLIAAPAPKGKPQRQVGGDDGRADASTGPGATDRTGPEDFAALIAGPADGQATSERPTPEVAALDGAFPGTDPARTGSTKGAPATLPSLAEGPGIQTLVISATAPGDGGGADASTASIPQAGDTGRQALLASTAVGQTQPVALGDTARLVAGQPPAQATQISNGSVPGAIPAGDTPPAPDAPPAAQVKVPTGSALAAAPAFVPTASQTVLANRGQATQAGVTALDGLAAEGAVKLGDQPLPIGDIGRLGHSAGGSAVSVSLGAGGSQSPAGAPQVTPGQIASQIADGLSASRSSQDVVLQLDPPELGQLRISLTIAERSVTAHVLADLPEVEAFLRRHADDLTSHLRDAGFDSIDLAFSGRERDGTAQTRTDAADPGMELIDDGGAAAAGPSRAATLLTITDHLDIRI